MTECQWWTFGSALVVLAVVNVLGSVWCLNELRRKWRSVPELWGIDWLDTVYRIERKFGLALAATDFEDWSPDQRVGRTAGQLWELVANKLQSVGVAAPADGWDRLVVLLSESLNIRTGRIIPESKLYGDLGMLYGLD